MCEKKNTPDGNAGVFLLFAFFKFENGMSQ